MNRLTAADAAHAFNVTRRTIHRWASEGRIHRHWNGYDLHELNQAEASRSEWALRLRAGLRQ